MSKRFVITVVFALLMYRAADTAADMPVQKRPNVLFVAVDDLNDWVSALTEVL